jgi:ParB/RepB/Spo0J family partition protein
MPFIDPHLIVINSRQRTGPFDTADLEESIERLGQLQPIVVRLVANELGMPALTLVAGGRRLQACKNLNRDVEYTLLDSLDDFSAECAELEENIKRDDLPWVDRALAINNIHELYKTHHTTYWTIEATASKIGLAETTVFNNIKVVKFATKNPEIFKLTSLLQALTSVDRITDRILAAEIDTLSQTAQLAFKGKKDAAGEKDNGEKDKGEGSDLVPANPNPINVAGSPAIDMANPSGFPPVASPIPNRTLDSVICTSFLDWAPAYTGPKFNFIHCDFPYGVNIGGSHGLWDVKKYENDPKIFFTLTDCLINNFDRFASHSCHLMFWFAPRWYCETLNKLQSLGLEVLIPPMIWHHSDNRGMTPWIKGVMQPRRVYDMAFVAQRGGRQLLKDEIPNLYGAPLVSRPIHPTQKPESMLRHFFSMLVDNTTSMLDPTCGSASALNAAESLGAKATLGIEYDAEYAKAANVYLNEQRSLRRASKEVTQNAKNN